MNNPTSVWDAGDYATHGRFVADHGATILAILDAQPGERILDVGCGDGALTARIAAAGADVHGIDASPELVAAARERGVDAEVVDAAEFRGDGYDAVFSNAALHWMLDPAPVAAALAGALAPGGRLVVEFGGFGNIAAIRTALTAAMHSHGYPDADPGQYYPTAQQYTEVLEAAGFTDIDALIVPRQTLLPGTMSDWLHTFRCGFLAAHDVPLDEREVIIAETQERLVPALYDPAGDRWYADYVRLRVTARVGARPQGRPARP